MGKAKKMIRELAFPLKLECGNPGRISSLMLDVQELQEPVLYTAALTPMPIERARHLSYQGKRRFSKKM